MVHRVGQVVERADAADAEPADQAALRRRGATSRSGRPAPRPAGSRAAARRRTPRGEPPLDRPEQHADRDHRDDLADALDLLVEGEHRVGHEGRRVLRIGRHLVGMRGVGIGVRLGGDLGRAPAPPCAALAPGAGRAPPAACARPAAPTGAGRRPRRTPRESRSACARPRGAIGQADQAEGEKVVEADRFLVRAAQVEDELADRVPSTAPMTTPAPRPRARRPRASARPKSPRSCRPSRPRPSSTNGKAVPSLSPASPVSAKRSRSRSPGLGHLHVGGEHRIGRREDAAEQDRRAERQAERRARRRRRSAPP